MKTNILFCLSVFLPFFVFGQGPNANSSPLNPAEIYKSEILAPSMSPLGCLSAPNGQYPTETYTPVCDGIPEIVSDAGWAGEFSMVNVTSGVEYTFIVDVPSYYITVGNSAGTAVLAEGTGTVSWTATQTGPVRFYVHTDSACGSGATSTEHRRLIQCGTPPVEPSYGCDQIYIRTNELANNISKNLNFALANDFFVPKESAMYRMKSITARLLPLTGVSDLASFDIKIMSDSGSNSPGSVIHTMTNVVPKQTVQLPDEFAGYPTYAVTLDMADFTLPVNPATDTRYWIALQGTAPSAPSQGVFWVGYRYVEGWKTASNYQSADGGATYTQVEYAGSHFDSNWSIDAECFLVGTEENTKNDFSYYPNPVHDILTIKSIKTIETVHVYNMAGQKMAVPAKTVDGKIDMSRLIPGTYIISTILEGGRNESFKIIKK